MVTLSHPKPLEYQYGNQIIEFDLTNGVMVNATEMAKIFGKRPYDFLKKPSTKRIIAFWMTKLDKSEWTNRPLALLETASSPLEVGGRMDDSGVSQDDYDPRILRIGRGGGEGGETWMCRKLAIKFAAWLDVEFEDWLLDILDSLLFGPMGQNLSILREIATLTNRRQALLKQAVPDPVQQEVANLTRQINHLNRTISDAKGKQLDMLRQLDQPN